MSPTRRRLLQALRRAPAAMRPDGGCETLEGERFQRSAVRGARRSGHAMVLQNVQIGDRRASSQHVLLITPYGLEALAVEEP